LSVAQHAQNPMMLMVAQGALGVTLFFLGAVAAAHTHFTQGITLYDPQQHRALAFRYGVDVGVVCHIYAAWALWILGYPEQGLARSQEAVTLAQQRAHPFSLSFVLSYAAVFHLFRHEVRAVQERAEAVMKLAQEQRFPSWMAQGAMLCGWTLAQQAGQAQEG